MNLKLDAATSQRRDEVIRMVGAGLALFVCEFALIKWILAQPANQRDLIDYAYLVVLAGPLLSGFGLRRRVRNLQLAGEVTARAAAQINSDVSGMLSGAYCLILGLWIIHSLVK